MACWLRSRAQLAAAQAYTSDRLSRLGETVGIVGESDPAKHGGALHHAAD